MLRVSFIGSGNVATRMATRLREVGAQIVQICSRSGTPVSELNPNAADLIIVAVSDDSIQQVLNSIESAGNAIWVHTAGSVGMNVFDTKKFPRHGVLYPLQTMLKTRAVDWNTVPLLIEGDPEIENVARMMSPTVIQLDSNSRLRLHAAAVMCCNMVMFLWQQSQQIAECSKLDYSLLKPLMKMTYERAAEIGPENAMTGPAKRGDLNTIKKHIEALPDDIAETYREISRQMLAKFHPEIEL
ncbi:MAG: DUF2520 domain-containing protein [Bacteroidales bacterium]|nr:DUF2520 domain-containing protein [Bacteroidales bacterium]